jgi:hypothetical protein
MAQATLENPDDTDPPKVAASKPIPGHPEANVVSWSSLGSDTLNWNDVISFTAHGPDILTQRAEVTSASLDDPPGVAAALDVAAGLIAKAIDVQGPRGDAGQLAHLHGSGGDHGRQFHRLLLIGGTEQVETVGHLGALDVRTIGKDRLAITHPYGRRRCGWLQRSTGLVVITCGGSELAVCGDAGLTLRRSGCRGAVCWLE